MEKTIKLLHKKLDKKFKGDYFKVESKRMEELFNFDKLPFINKTEFDFYKNQIVYRAIQNKQSIEKAYKEARIKMDDYYDALSYEQKNRLMDYEIKTALKDMISFKYNDQNIYIPFFDERLNTIYENEMVLFDLKKYADIMLYYDSLMKKNLYGYVVYDSSFSDLELIHVNEGQCALYCHKRNKLYFLMNYEMVDYLTLPYIDKEHLVQLSVSYFNNDTDKLVDDLYAFTYIDEKLYKKFTKRRK